MIVCADTGFLVSLYGGDANAVAAAALAGTNPVFIVTPLVEAEFRNAVELRVFRKQWTQVEARVVLEHFLHHQAAGVFQMERFSAEIWQAALTLSRRHTAKLGVRTLDLLHVAAAIVFKPDAFFTFDQRQRRLAKAERLRVLPS